MTGPLPEPDVTIDATGLLCPQPVLELARAARALGSGIIAVLADDPAAASDIPAWCRLRQAELVAVEPGEARATRYVVRVTP